MSRAASPRPKGGKMLGRKPIKGSKGDPARKVKPGRRIGTGTEPRTLEGRARKKILMGLQGQMGCVFAYQELLLVVKELPPEWLKKECL